MANHPTSSLFKSNPIDQKHPRAPSIDARDEIVSVFDHAGTEHRHTRQNATELVNKSHWTRDKDEAAKRRAQPLEAFRHTNPELGPNGVLESPRRALGRPTRPGIAYV